MLYEAAMDQMSCSGSNGRVLNRRPPCSKCRQGLRSVCVLRSATGGSAAQAEDAIAWEDQGGED